MSNLIPFTMRREKDNFGRYKIEVVDGFYLKETSKRVIFWLPATTVENNNLFTVVLYKRIAKEFGCKPEEVICSYLTGNIA